MNGMENILKRIERDAGAEVEQIRASSDKECEAIRDRYKEQAQAAYWKILTAGKAEADARAQRLASLAETEARKQMLALKQELIGKTFARAEEKLLSMPEEEYVAFLAGMAVRASSTGTEEILLSPADRSRYGKRVANAANQALEAAGKTGGLRLSESTRNIRGGLILQNGKVEMNCSVETMLAMRRNELAGTVAEKLFL